tara:strand:- start:31 stop:264 length:234 start_codon:yes stop_codon:yes gene_type:complete
VLNEIQKKQLTKRVILVIGIEKLKKFSQNQLLYMDRLLDERLEELKNDQSKLNDEELIGIYEMVFEHLLPYDELLEH